MKKIVTPPRSGDPAPTWRMDGSVWFLIVANVFSLTVGFHQDWSMVSLMLLYWTQSVVIGISNVFRILALDRFSTEDFTSNGEPVAPTPETKTEVAGFFALHYGFFQIGHLIFLSAYAKGEGLFVPSLWACTGAFALNHLWSYRYNRDLDRQGTPNIGVMMFTPYLRVVPMHLTILLGNVLTQTDAAFWLFGTLKTVADVGMHLVEHAQLKKARGTRARPGGRPG